MRIFTLFFLSWSLLAGHAMANHENITIPVKDSNGSNSTPHDAKLIYGYIEKVTLVDKDLTLSAKLDTGAKSASLNATHITELDVDGKRYLRFIVPSKEGDVVFQSEYLGKVHIKSRVDESNISSLLRESIKRPVVLMRIKLGAQEQLLRVNLTNRKRFIYPLLLGRDAIIAFHGVIDPDLKYTLKNQP